MFEPKIYVRCDILEVGEQDLQTFEDDSSYEEYECCFSMKYTTEKTNQHFKLNLDFEMRFQNQEEVTKVLVKFPYSFTYSLDKYNEFSLENIKISALNEVASEINQFYGFYLMLLFQHNVQIKMKEMS